MTMLYVYGVLDEPTFCDGVPRGYGDTAVFPLVSGNLAAAVSHVERPTIEASVENVWRHERVLSALMEERAVLPMRFGTIVPGADKLVSRLTERRDHLLQNLIKVRDKVELALRIQDDRLALDLARSVEPAECRSHGPGATYLMAKVERHRGAAAMSAAACAAMQAIRDRLDRLSVNSVWDYEGVPALPIKASYLVGRDHIDAFMNAVDDLTAVRCDVSLTCTGPWAPYSFVDTAVSTASAL